MKISELVTELEVLRAEHGDAEVVSYRPDRDYGDTYEKPEVEFDANFGVIL